MHRLRRHVHPRACTTSVGAAEKADGAAWCGCATNALAARAGIWTPLGVKYAAVTTVVVRNASGRRMSSV